MPKSDISRHTDLAGKPLQPPLETAMPAILFPYTPDLKADTSRPSSHEPPHSSPPMAQSAQLR